MRNQASNNSSTAYGGINISIMSNYDSLFLIIFLSITFTSPALVLALVGATDSRGPSGATGSAHGPTWDYSWGWGSSPGSGWGYGSGSGRSPTGFTRGFGYGSGTGSGSGFGYGSGSESGGARGGGGGGGYGSGMGSSGTASTTATGGGRKEAVISGRGPEGQTRQYHG